MAMSDSEWTLGLDVYGLQYSPLTELVWTGEFKQGYLRKHESVPELKSCPVASEPFVVFLEGHNFLATVTVDLGWGFYGSMGGIWLKLEPSELGRALEHLAVFKIRYGLPDPNRPTILGHGSFEAGIHDTQDEGDGYSRTQFLFLIPGKSETKTIIYDFRGDSMSVSSATAKKPDNYN